MDRRHELGLRRRVTTAAVVSAEQALLANAQLFRTLEADDVKPILGLFEIRDLECGSLVFEQGEMGHDEMYVLLSGRIAITRRVDDVRRRSQIIGPGESFGELSVLDPGPRERTATALTSVRLAVLRRKDYLAWAVARPHVVERLLRVLARRLRRTDDEALDLLFVDVGGRLARTLLDLATRFGERTAWGIYVEHGLSQSQLAEIVGSSRETLNKQLNGFTDRGWLTVDRGRFLLTNVDRLEARARVGLANLNG